jgi:peptidoglycan/xylan/chitin deacetylase (PgdA/CDA1 family)
MDASSVKRKIKGVWEKNGPDFRAVLNGNLPTILGRNGKGGFEPLPVFVFHTVQPDLFEAQLSYLAENGYRSLDGDGLLKQLDHGQSLEERTVALTFDDATGSAWTVAYPLLKKYGFGGILFAIAGLVAEGGVLSPNLEDVWAGKASVEEVEKREAELPLCSWKELEIMERKGVFDIQSHSLTHARIFTSPQVLDFINPRFDPYFYHNINLPVSRDEPAEAPLRKLRYGRPIYASTSRLSGQRRLLENLEVSERLEKHVRENGGEAYFLRPGWRNELGRLHRELLESMGSAFDFEIPEETDAAIRREMANSKKILEERLEKDITHLCYPWYQGSPGSDRIAAESGYKVVYYGLEYEDNSGGKEYPHHVRRISEEYLHCLPGKDQSSVSKVWMEKVIQSIRKRRLV